MPNEVAIKSIDLGGEYLKAAGPLPFTLLCFVALFGAVTGWIARLYLKSKRETEKKVELMSAARIKHLQDECKSEIEALTSAHRQSVENLKEIHANNLKALAENYMSLCQNFARYPDIVAGFRQDVQRFYDALNDAGVRDGDHKVEVTKALTQLIAAITTFPLAMENTFRKLQSETGGSHNNERRSSTRTT